MRTLLLLRHAHASDVADSDHERPLTGRGTMAARSVGEWLRSRGVHFDTVGISSARRALETWAAVDPDGDLGRGADEVASDRLYLASAEQLLEWLHERPPEHGCVLVVAHNPGIHELAVSLAGEGDRDAYDRLRSGYPPAALCRLTFDGAWTSLAPGRARLEGFEPSEPR